MTKPVSDLIASERLAFLARAAEILSSSLEYETTLERVAQLTVPTLADWCSIELLEESGKLRNVAVAHSDPQKVVWARSLRQRYPIDPAAARGVANVIRTGEPELYPEIPDALLVQEAQTPAHLELIRRLGMTSAIVVPLTARERTCGTLTLISAESGRRYTEDDADLALDLARRAAVAIENARLYSDAQRSVREAEDASALLDAIVEHSPIGKAFLDRELRYVRVNAAMAAMRARSVEEQVGRKVDELMPLLAAKVAPLMRRALAGEVIEDVQLRGADVAGDRHWVVSYYPVPTGKGEVIGIGEVVVDVTERRELELQNARLAAIVESTDEAIVGKSLDGIIESWNEGARRLYGYTAEEAIGKHISMLAPPSLKHEIDELLPRLARGDRIERFETVRVAKDGRRLDIALVISPIWDADGKIVGASNFPRDITARKATERALQASEARKKAIIESALDAIVTIDADGTVIEFNPAAERIFGYPREDAVGRELAGLIVPERLREQHRAGLARYRASGEGRVIGRRLEMPALRADGTEFTTELTVTRVEIDDPNAPPLFSATLRDVTETRQNALANARLAAIVESSADAIIGKSLDGVIESWNDAASQLYGYGAEETIGKHISMLAPPERIGEIAVLLERTRRGERVENFETERVTKDGRRIDIALTLSPIRAPHGAIVGASTIARDVTEQKRAQREQHEFEVQLLETQKLESLGVLAGGIAHDFNNLLVGVLGNASIALAQTPHDSPLRETLERIELAAQRTSELTRQMLAYSGKGKYVVQPIRLSHVVEEMADLIESTISKKARLQLSFDPSTPTVEADVNQMRQVVLNLITNASEALGDESGTITIATGALDADREYLANYELADDLPAGRYAYLDVTDTGSGMDEETRARIFDPFYTTKFTGRGLGLAAALGIVRGHRGAIKVYSEVGRGTSFKMLFPASEKAEAAGPPTGDVADEWRGSGIVLVADDDESVRLVAATMLERLGFDVLVASDGHEALRTFRERRDGLCLVVLDLMMPGMDGSEALAEFERLGSTVPIVLSSGYNAQDLSQRFVNRGVTAFLQKPYRFGELAGTVRRVIEARAGT